MVVCLCSNNYVFDNKKVLINASVSSMAKFIYDNRYSDVTIIDDKYTKKIVEAVRGFIIDAETDWLKRNLEQEIKRLEVNDIKNDFLYATSADRIANIVNDVIEQEEEGK